MGDRLRTAIDIIREILVDTNLASSILNPTSLAEPWPVPHLIVASWRGTISRICQGVVGRENTPPTSRGDTGLMEAIMVHRLTPSLPRIVARIGLDQVNEFMAALPQAERTGPQTEAQDGKL